MYSVIVIETCYVDIDTGEWIKNHKVVLGNMAA